MRILILELDAIIVGGAFIGMFHAIWRHRRTTGDAGHAGASLAVEMAWAAVPCLMFMAAACPAVALIIDNCAASK